MEPIIDIHSHMGDICFPGGEALIAQKGVKNRNWVDIVSISEVLLHRFPETVPGPGGWWEEKEIQASLDRNFTATLENFLVSMVTAGVTYSISLPVPPNVKFLDIQKAAADHSSIIPFTGVDFSKSYDVEAALRSDVAAGAKGMKLHSILQRERLTGQKIFDAVEAFAPHGLPILLHTGICKYYTKKDDKRLRERPEFGDVKDVLILIKAFPKVNFILGHAGLSQWDELKQSVGALKNVWVDGTFKSPSGIQDLIRVLGKDKVLFGSDWPWGKRRPALKIVRKACKGDYLLERKILFENAAQLMNLSS